MLLKRLIRDLSEFVRVQRSGQSLPFKIYLNKFYNKDCDISFYEDESSLRSSTVFNNNSKAKNVFSTTIENYFIDKKLNKIDFLKIDCEGAEYDIIESLDEDYLINNIQKICLEYHFNKDGKINTILNKLKKCNFNIVFEYGDHQINNELGIIYAYK